MVSRSRRFNVDASRGEHQTDRTLVDFFVVDSGHGKTIERPWITLVIDVTSRMVAGHHLSLEPPSLPASLTGGGGDIERLPD